MRLKKIITKHFPFKGYTSLTVFPFVFIRKSSVERFNSVAERHEITHALQQIETLWIFFLLIYCLEYIIKLPLCRFSHDRAYHSISFEREAYLWQYDAGYNSTRHHYAWRHFVFKIKER
jgi:hypothetical protein